MKSLCSFRNDKQQPKFYKKAKNFQKRQKKLLLFWPILLFFLAFLEIFGFHVAYIAGTYRVQKSDLDDSVEGTKKAM
jgi:hypothetical protein